MQTPRKLSVCSDLLGPLCRLRYLDILAMLIDKRYKQENGWYTALAERPDENDELISCLNEMWALYEPYADSNFSSGFAHDPFARYWEMCLAIRLLNEGKQLLKKDELKKNAPNPDICVIEKTCKVWIEAVCPTEGDSEVHGVRPPKNRTMGAIPEQQAMLRISQGIATKIAAFSKYLEDGVIANTDIILIAVNTGHFGILTNDDEYPLAVRCVFPAGNEIISFDSKTGQQQGPISSVYENTIQKGEVDIPKPLFEDPANSSISGLIYSRTGLGTDPNNPRQLLHINNPYADNQLAENWIDWNKEMRASITNNGIQIER